MAAPTTFHVTGTFYFPDDSLITTPQVVLFWPFDQRFKNGGNIISGQEIIAVPIVGGVLDTRLIQANNGYWVLEPDQVYPYLIGGLADIDLGTAGGGPTSAYALAVLADSPYAYYRLGELTGAIVAVDSSGNGRNALYASLVMDATGLVPGDSNNGATLAGSTKYVDTGTTFIGSGSLAASTLEIITDVLAVPGTELVWGSAAHYPRITYTAAGNFVGQVIIGGVVKTVTSPAVYNLGDVHHVAVTHDSTNLILYVDGTSVATTAAVGACTGFVSNNFQIGGSANDSAFQATVDEASFNTTALSAGRITAHYAASGLVAPGTPATGALADDRGNALSDDRGNVILFA